MVRVQNLASLELDPATSQARAKSRTTPAASPFVINIRDLSCIMVMNHGKRTANCRVKLPTAKHKEKLPVQTKKQAGPVKIKKQAAGGWLDVK
ncbi:unnamed protein product [Linum trigynum]|uniref:Uncharacterized protein n=1 Tax=Linum trigynum TaxID=586398 RepID=A0AAV2G8U8_9ROSI